MLKRVVIRDIVSGELYVGPVDEAEPVFDTQETPMEFDSMDVAFETLRREATMYPLSFAGRVLELVQVVSFSRTGLFEQPIAGIFTGPQW